MSKPLSYAALLVTQGNFKFYSVAIPSDVLARTCFVVNRFDDPEEGFQRYLDEDRAQQIAEYMDSGFGSVPTNIILSAQEDSDLEYISKTKTIRFKDITKAFMIIDGQHRVYGFSKAKTSLRVPVIIYSGLDREAETKLFIDINTKQRSVPNELLLDIKKQALYENESETILGELFDLFNDSPDSILLGLLSPAARTSGKISRVTFNRAFKPIIDIVTEIERNQAYKIFNAYLQAFASGMTDKGLDVTLLTNPSLFAGTIQFFPEVARRVQDKYGEKYTTANFTQTLNMFFERVSTNLLKKPGTNRKELLDSFRKTFHSSFSLRV